MMTTKKGGGGLVAWHPSLPRLMTQRSAQQWWPPATWTTQMNAYPLNTR